MKKVFGYALAAGILVLPIAALAADFRVGNQPSIKTSENITNDVYIAGGSITSAGAVTGDLVAAGGTIVITGNVSADVAATGGSITILSTVGDDLRVGGGNIVIQGGVGGDLVVGGGNITIGGPGVGGDAAIGGGTIRIDAPIKGTLRIGGGEVYINAPVAGVIMVQAGHLTLGSQAVINGDLTYKADTELVKEDGAIVNGKVTYEPRAHRNAPALLAAALFSILAVGKFLALLACALIVGLLFRRFSYEVIATAVARPWFEMGRGLLVLAATPVISVFLMVTVVGIPLGILGFLGYFGLLLVSWIVAPVIVGSVAYKYFSKKEWEVSWKTILLGALIYTIVGIVPFVGWLAQLLLMLLSVGAIVALKLEEMKGWR